MALRRRRPEAGLIHHSDRGVQHASGPFQRLLEAHGITCSMSRTGDCLDNAVMESFFGTLKTELDEPLPTHAAARAAVFEYIEASYRTPGEAWRFQRVQFPSGQGAEPLHPGSSLGLMEATT